jgi:hypothetical protein
VITSCGRFDLLYRTLDSFFKQNTYKHINQIIIIDDSGNAEKAFRAIDSMVKELYSHFEIRILINEVNIGQVKSIDLAYSYVQNPYIFHLEDDWEFYGHGFIEESMAILENYSWIITVWLRSHDDTNGHPIGKR